MIVVDAAIEKAQKQLDNGFEDEADIHAFFETVLTELFENINNADSSYDGDEYMEHHDFEGMDINLNTLFNEKEPIAYSLRRGGMIGNIILYASADTMNYDHLVGQTLPFSLRIIPIDREVMRHQLLVALIECYGDDYYFNLCHYLVLEDENIKFAKELLENFVIKSEEEANMVRRIYQSNDFEDDDIIELAFVCRIKSGLNLEETFDDIWNRHLEEKELSNNLFMEAVKHVFNKHIEIDEDEIEPLFNQIESLESDIKYEIWNILWGCSNIEMDPKQIFVLLKNNAFEKSFKWGDTKGESESEFYLREYFCADGIPDREMLFPELRKISPRVYRNYCRQNFKSILKEMNSSERKAYVDSIPGNIRKICRFCKTCCRDCIMEVMNYVED
jgi:hypothetical protein